MQFYHILPALLAALTLASPILDSQPVDITALQTRDLPRTANYIALSNLQRLLNDGGYYVLTQEWPLGSVDSDDEDEPFDPALEALRAKLGFTHIALVVGQVTSDQELDFEATVWHQVVSDQELYADVEPLQWKAPKSKPLRYVGRTTKAQVDQIAAWSKSQLQVLFTFVASWRRIPNCFPSDAEFLAENPKWTKASHCGSFVWYLADLLVPGNDVRPGKTKSGACTIS